MVLRLIPNKGSSKALPLSKAMTSKIEKLPRGIEGEKSSKEMASSRNLVSTIGAQASRKKGDGIVTRKYWQQVSHAFTKLT